MTNINSNITADGPDFFYRAVKVLVTSVTVDSGTSNVVQQYLPVNPLGAPCLTPRSSHAITINGSGFQTSGGSAAMYVSFEGVSGEFPATFVSPNQLTLTLPDLDSVNIQRVGCVLPSGATGARNIDTVVPVTVVNKRNSCDDTLPGALIIRPCDTACRAAFPLNIVLGPGGTMSVTLGLTSPTVCTSNCSFSVLTGTAVTLAGLILHADAINVHAIIVHDELLDSGTEHGGSAPVDLLTRLQPSLQGEHLIAAIG